MRNIRCAPILRELETALSRTKGKIEEKKQGKSRLDWLEAEQDRNVAALMEMSDPEIYRVFERCEIGLGEIATRLVRHGKKQWDAGERAGYERGRHDARQTA